MAKVDIELRRATRLIASGPVVLITSQYRGKKNLMAAGWLAPVSSDPPMVAVAVHPGRYTYGLIEKSGQFALNIPPRPLAEQVKKAGTLTGAEVDKFLQVGLTPYEGKQVSAPLIAECIGHLECGVVERVAAGDHTLFIAEIVAASCDEAAFDGEKWTLADEKLKPLHHLGGDWYAVLEAPLGV
jgi:flavin reductase (DIM6/NTAB) family NADH-FMN oxidoreductase RutF